MFGAEHRGYPGVRLGLTGGIYRQEKFGQSSLGNMSQAPKIKEETMNGSGARVSWLSSLARGTPRSCGDKLEEEQSRCEAERRGYAGV